MPNFKDLKLETKVPIAKLKINDAIELDVRTYLPMQDKIALVTYVVDHAIDENTGRFSPLRIGLFFDLAVAFYYGGISFEDDVNALDAYDALETNGVLDSIVNAIPSEEYDAIKSLVEETAKDIADYNSSFAGILRIASSEAGGLGEKTEELLTKVKNREGLEILDEIKNVVGKD